MAQILAMPQSPPIFTNLTPESISEETQSLIDRSNALRDEIASNITPATATFKNVVLPLIDDFNQASRRLNILGSLLAEASPDPAIRHSSRAAQKRILAAQSGHAMRGDIAALVGAIYDRAHLSDADHLDAEDWHLLRLMRSEFLPSGSMLLDKEQRQRLPVARAEIDELQLAAVDTITEANGDGIWLHRDELEGMSSEVLGSLDVDRRAEDSRPDAAQTVCFVTFKAKHANEMSSLVEDGEVRRKYQAAYRRRCPENIPRLARVVVLRDELARILGFKNYASMKIEEMMAHNVGDVLATLRTICHRLRLAAKAEDEQLLELKRQEASLDEESSDTVLNDWDWSFYARKFRTRNVREDGHKIEEYFEMNYTWTATCGLFEELFQIEFHEITGKISAWHNSVRVYTVWDGPRRNDDFLGYLYADLIGRDGKYQNQRHVLIEPVRSENVWSTSYIDSADNRYLPEVYFSRRLAKLSLVGPDV